MMMNWAEVRNENESTSGYTRHGYSEEVLQPSSLLDCSLVCVHVSVPHQQKAWTDGYPADSPETTRVETKHGLDVITETVGT